MLLFVAAPSLPKIFQHTLVAASKVTEAFRIVAWGGERDPGLGAGQNERSFGKRLGQGGQRIPALCRAANSKLH